MRHILLRIVLLISLAGLLSEIVAVVSDGDRPFWAQMISLSYEGNLPTWFSAGQLFLCSAVLAAIALVENRRRARYVPHWWGLCLIFAYISLDEMISIHENADELLGSRGGFLYFEWVIPATIVVGIIGLIYLNFLRYLPKATRVRFIVAGMIYVGGALGVEMILGYWTDTHGKDNFGYGLIDWVEESMEIFGISLFLLALLGYLETRVRIGAGAGGESSPDAGP
ncbi:MAG: hypothetical protein HKN82_05335 [Akkermansiaceae bacterium]|nr:hypothetical protein [Akkermansiaceae bacterium]NNM27876.1 hypothetical protein [Akkermansiaceae bacterium]